MAGDTASSPERLEVRLRAGAPGLRKLLTGVITAVASVLFIVGGSAHPASFGGILFILLGAAGLALCVAGALVLAGQVTGRRPVLVLDGQGVRVPAVWPRSRRADRLLPWPELAAVCAWSQGPPSGGRQGTLFPQRLAFLPADGPPASTQAGSMPPGSPQAASAQAAAGQDTDGRATAEQAADGQATGEQAAVGQAAVGQDGGGERRARSGNGGGRRPPPENGAELLAIKVADVACVPTLRWSVLIRPGWDATVEEIAKAVQRRRDDVPFIDRRDQPQLRRKRRPATGRPATGKASTGRSAAGRPTAGKPVTEKSATGKQSAGESAAGSPVAGKPGTGKSAAGKRSERESATGKVSGGKTAGKPSGGKAAKPAAGGQGPAGSDRTRSGGRPAAGGQGPAGSDGTRSGGRPGAGGPAAPNEP